MDTLLILAAVVVGLVLLARAAGNPLGHSRRFCWRRLDSWLPLGF